jgi:hypothetical protein
MAARLERGAAVEAPSPDVRHPRRGDSDGARAMTGLRSAALATIAVGLLLPVFGCSEGGGDGESAEQLYAAGMAELEGDMSDVDMEDAPWEWDVDVSSAHEHFDDAAEADPRHCGAVLMAGATRLLMVLTDPELGDILDSLFPEEPDSGRADCIFWYRREPDIRGLCRHLAERERQDFHFSELQRYIDDEVLPALDYADGRLTDFEEMDCVVLVVVGEDSLGNDIEVEIDAADAYFLHTALDAVRAGCLVAVSYDVDVDDGQTLQELIESDPNFLTLTRPSAMGDAYDALSAIAAHLDAGCDALEAETDDQTNDIVTETDGYLPLDELLGDDSLETIRDAADAIDDALVKGLSFNPVDEDPSGPDVEVLIDLSELFNDPLVDLRDYFPAHSWPEPDSIAVVRPIQFPDPEFDGITPEMTNGEWELILQWMEE